jgi:hypothetical protein
MPYTISHVAAAVPVFRLLARLRILSAVVVGSLVPDFGYLMPNSPPRLATHSMDALLTFCLPVGLLSYWAFQYLIKTPLLSVLPDQAYMRWRPYAAPARVSSGRQWLLAACGVLVGAVVHLAWDGFTHEQGRGVRMVPELAAPLLDVHGHLVTGTLLLQGLSSLVGIVVVIGGIAYALRPTGGQAVAPRALTSFERRTWVVAYVCVTLALCAGFSFLVPDFGAHRLAGLGVVAVALLRALVPASVGIGLLMTIYLRAKPMAHRSV